MTPLTPPLTCLKDMFSLPEDITYLNCCYRGPLMKHVEQVGFEAVSQNNHPNLIKPQDFFDPFLRVQKLYAQLINAPDPNRIVLIPSTSYGMANAANNIELTAGDQILMVDEQFPSNYYIWQRRARATGAFIRKIENPPSFNIERWNEHFLNAITTKTKVVTIGTVHWADGTLFDLKAIRKKTREVGAYFILDGTQSIGALPFDVQEIDPDALIVSAYKWLFAPYGSGLAYYGPRFDEGTPIEESWMNRVDSEKFEKIVDYQLEYKPGAARYQVGQSSNFIVLPMMEACLQQILDWGVENIQGYLASIGANNVSRFEALDCSIAPDDQRAHHLFGIYLNGRVDKEKLRASFKSNNVIVSFRGTGVRVGPHLYNEEKDFETLASCIEECLT